MKNIYKASLLLLFFLLIELIVVVTIQNITEKKIEGIKTQRLNIYEAQYTAINSSYKNFADIIYSEVVNQERVLVLYRKIASANKREQDEIRQSLYNMLLPTYLSLKEKSIRQLHFHLPNSISFLRFHAPREYGDSLIGVRKSLEIANRERRDIHGFEEGRVKNGFRNVYPIIDIDGTHLGSVEISLSFNSLKNEIEKMTGSYVQFMIKKEIVERKVWDQHRGFYIESPLSDLYLIEKDSMKFEQSDRVKKSLNSILKKEIALNYQKQLEGAKSFAIFKEIEKKGYLALFMPIENVANEKGVAYLYTFIRTDVPMQIKNDSQYITLIISLLLASIFAMLYALLASHEKVKKQNIALQNSQEELRELNEHLKQEVERAIEEKLHALSELQAQQTLTIQLNRMAEVGGMITAVTHQWKQPLVTMSYLTYSLDDFEEGVLSKKRITEIKEELQRQLDYMNQTVNDFNNFFNPAKVKKPFTPCNSINRIQKLFKSEFVQHKIEINICDHEHVKIYGQENEFMQALLIIINNAKDAILKSGKREGRILNRFEKEGEWVKIRIQDNGGGIPEELLPDKIFEPYFTTKGDKGTGIGLQIAKRVILESMGGKIGARNIEGGAEFIIELPLYDEEFHNK